MRAQVQLFSTAEVVVAPHGAGLANIVMMPPGGAVIELVGSVVRNPHFLNLGKAVGLCYGLVTNQGLPEERPGWHDDFSIDIDRVLACLERMNITPMV